MLEHRAELIARNKANPFTAESLAKAAEWHASEDGRTWHSEHGVRSWDGREPTERPCVRCGKPFASRVGHAEFCSRSCYQRGCYAKQRTDPRVCVWCGETFMANRYRTATCCSRLCSNRKGGAERRLQSHAGTG
jgi:hypothetical protein